MSLLSRIYGISFLFAANLALTAYVNSTYLSTFIPDKFLGFVYAAEALLTLIILELLPRTEKSLGNRRTTLLLLLANIASLALLATSPNKILVVIAFMVYFITNNLVAYAMDIFVRHFSTEKKAGTARGFYLMITNLAWIGAPFMTGFLVMHYGYGAVYFLVFLIVVYVFLAVNYLLGGFKDATYKHVSFLKSLLEVKKNKNVRNIIAVNFVLQFFFSWMIIYTPIYLHAYMGFNWQSIGSIFTVMLLPFVLFQYPLGRLADKYLGEKKLLALGWIILILATGTITFIHTHSLIVWALVLFMTRTGAATVEVMSETYFFKKVDDREPAVISFFRAMTPLAFLVGPILGSLFLFFVPFSSLFIILGGISFISFFFIIPLIDTK